jgi:hypothetical protein
MKKMIIAAIALTIATLPAEAVVRQVNFDYLTQYGYGVTFGSLTYDDSNVGVLTYDNLLSFSFNTGLGGTYDLAYVREWVQPADGMNYLGYNTVSRKFDLTDEGSVRYSMTAVETRGEASGFASYDYGSEYGPVIRDYGVDPSQTRGIRWFDIKVTETVLSSSVPESSTWAMMLMGFGALGWMLRSQKQPAITQRA